MIISWTGHRAEAFNHRQHGRVLDFIDSALDHFQPEYCIEGQAHGVDLWVAKRCFLKGVPYIAARPYAGHTVPAYAKIEYKKALFHAKEIVVVNPDENYRAWYLHKRNEWMVDNSDMTIAVWNGSEKGGTKACVDYALKKNKPIFRYDPISGDRGWMTDARPLQEPSVAT